MGGERGMAVKIMIPTPLRGYTNKQDCVVVKGASVREVLNGLVMLHPTLKKHLFSENGDLRNFVNIYVNNEDIRYLQKEQTTLEENDVVSIIPSIAGGGFEL
jgi:molybdopterin converting factor small subunit